MPSIKVVKDWGYDCLGFDVNNDGMVVKIWCNLCREYSELTDIKSHKKGVSKIGKELLLFRRLELVYRLTSFNPWSF